MLMWSRKMLILRRKQTYTLCEPAQSKCTSTCHKSRTIRKFTGNTPQTRVRSTQIRHLPLHLAKEPLSVDKLFGESKDRLQLPASVSLLDFWTCRWPGHTGTRAQPDPRAHGHTGTGAHGHRGTRAQPRSKGTRAHGHTGTRAHGQGPPEDLAPTLSHALFHTQLSHARHLSHTTLSHKPCFFVTHHVSHTLLSHTQLCFTSRSSTTSFVFPSFPVPATTFGAHYFFKIGFGNSQRCSGDQWRMFCCNGSGAALYTVPY